MVGPNAAHGGIVRRVAPAIGLYFLAPLVAEFFLGDFDLPSLPLILALAPIYGGGALLIREVTRRTGRGWPTILLLALAYGVLEEGLLTQSLFNPDYAGHRLLDHGHVPWAVFVLGLHTVWSIATPIALVEEMTPARRTTTWLRSPGLVVAAVVFAIGVLATFATSYADGHFLATPAQLGISAAVVVALVVVAFRRPRVGPARRADGSSEPAPGPGLVVATTLAAGVAFMAGRDELPPGPGAVLMAVALAVPLGLTWRWSTQPGWGRGQRFALASGALLTYSWHAFTVSPLRGGGAVDDVVSHVSYAVAAVVLVWFGAVRVRRALVADRTPSEVRFP